MTVTETIGRFRNSYSEAFEAYLSHPSEGALHAAYELGRQAVADDLSILDLTEVHHTMLAAATARPRATTTAGVMAAASDFLLQVLSAYEMVQRGYREAQEELRSEREHADQLRRLADSSVAISSSLSIRDMLNTLTDHAREIVGVECCVAGIAGAEAGGPNVAMSRTRAFAGCDHFATDPRLSEMQALAAGLDGPARMDRATPEEASPFNDSALDPADVLIAPLRSRGHDYVGFIVLVGKMEGRFTDKDESIAIQLAQTVSAAIDNALLYERERRIAEALQRGLLPTDIPILQGVAVAARYLPGASGLNVGGDWYDVVSLPDNRTGVAMGDVVGRGVKAATVMGQLRTAFRAYAHDGSWPESVVGRLDRLMSTLDRDHFSTMVYLVWDPTERVAHTVLAGHPPPLLIDRAGRSRFLENDPSVPLGTVADFSYGSVRTSVDVGSTLVLYTDGLVEQEGGLEQGLARLQKAASYPSDDANQLCDRILKSMLPPDSEDDVAVVVLRFLGETEL
jgi:hypothetical protein